MLTASLRQMHADFMEWVEAFKQVSYDVLDLDANNFDPDFYQFRGRVKELERRIGYVFFVCCSSCCFVVVAAAAVVVALLLPSLLHNCILLLK